jgi:hypothetical protein
MPYFRLYVLVLSSSLLIYIAGCCFFLEDTIALFFPPPFLLYLDYIEIEISLSSYIYKIAFHFYSFAALISFCLLLSENDVLPLLLYYFFCLVSDRLFRFWSTLS